ncbi:MAG TPA: hypothetical protein VIV40_20060, partial [Kofleriaceae bacterium]
MWFARTRRAREPRTRKSCTNAVARAAWFLAQPMLRADPSRRSAMRNSGAVSQPHLIIPTRSKKTITNVARWTLYGSGALALAFGLAVWP